MKSLFRGEGKKVKKFKKRERYAFAAGQATSWDSHEEPVAQLVQPYANRVLKGAFVAAGAATISLFVAHVVWLTPLWLLLCGALVPLVAAACLIARRHVVLVSSRPH